jgi:hypothetical protein
MLQSDEITSLEAETALCFRSEINGAARVNSTANPNVKEKGLTKWQQGIQ